MCTSRYRLFCASCCGAKQQGLLTFLRSKAIERFNDHERSEMHKEAVEKLAAKFCRADYNAVT